MSSRRGVSRPGPGWRRRALVLYWMFIGAVIVGMALLVAALRDDNRPVSLAVVAAALGFAAAWALVVVVRHRRER